MSNTQSDVKNYFGEILNTRNPFNKYGFKGYCQNDEDGLISEIFRRIPIKGKKIFVEFGVGNGMENNTLQLLFQDWFGIWVGNEDLKFKVTNECTLQYIRTHVDKVIFSQIVGFLKDNTEKNLSFLSMDFDGNDAYFVKELLVLKPKVICVEYNANIVPPGVFCMPYDDNHKWAGDDYYGASLQHFVNILEGYKLIVCGATGVNAFFVREEYADLFPEVPKDILDIYRPANYIVYQGGHRPSNKTIEHLITRNVK